MNSVKRNIYDITVIIKFKIFIKEMVENGNLSNRSFAEMKKIISLINILLDRFEERKKKKQEEKEKELMKGKEWKKSYEMY